MRRRDFVLALGGAVIAPLRSACAQQRVGKRRLGVLNFYAEADSHSQYLIQYLAGALRERGWTDGGNLEIVWRWAGADIDALGARADELLASAPEVIFACSTSVTLELAKRTRSVPVVFFQVSDPVGNGMVDTLSRPGGNLTGFMNFESGICVKHFDLLAEMVPGLKRVGLVFNPRTAAGGGKFYAGPLQRARGGVAEIVPLAFADAAGAASAIDAFAAAPDSGLIVLPDISTAVHRTPIVEAARRNRLPSVYPYDFFVEAGGLMSCGVDVTPIYKDAADYIDRILKGAKPAGLPVQAPVKFDLTISLEAARTLGLSVPAALLARADQVLE